MYLSRGTGLKNHEFTTIHHDYTIIVYSVSPQSPLSQSLAFEQLPLCLTALIGQRASCFPRRSRRRRRRRQLKTLKLPLLCRATAASGNSWAKLRPLLACEPSYEPPTSARLMVRTKRSLLARNCRSLAKTCHFKARISHFSLYLFSHIR